MYVVISIIQKKDIFKEELFRFGLANILRHLDRVDSAGKTLICSNMFM